MGVLAHVQGAAKTACWMVTCTACRRLDHASLSGRLARPHAKGTDRGRGLVTELRGRL
jgi:hypothetical protein